MIGAQALAASLAGDVIDRVPSLGARAAYAKQAIRDKLIDHKNYIRQYGQDMPEIRDWTWGGGTGQARQRRTPERARGG